MEFKEKIKISVIMPVYNGEKYIKEAIESILNQTYTNFELIILNDKSTDDTKNIIEDYARKDSRIVLVEKIINVGPAHLRNEGFNLAKGEYIALLDADDIAINTRFEKQIKLLDENPTIGVCGSWFTTFGENIENRIIKHPENHDQIKVAFLRDCSIGNSTATFRKNVLNGLTYNTEFVPCEDYDLWSKLILNTNFYNIQESLVEYRIHPQNISTTKIENVYNARKRIKLELLETLDIDIKDEQKDNYFNLLEGKDKLSFEDTKACFECEKIAIEKNSIHKKFNETLFKNLMTKMLSRIIRKSEKLEFYQLNYFKKNYKSFYEDLKLSDKIKLFSICIKNYFL